LRQVQPAPGPGLFPQGSVPRLVRSASVGVGVGRSELTQLDLRTLCRLQDEARARRDAPGASREPGAAPGEASLLDLAEEQCRRALRRCFACSWLCGADRWSGEDRGRARCGLG